MRPVSKREFAAAMRQLGLPPGRPYAIALSGGIDSMALAWLLQQYNQQAPVVAFTVDHQFRPESRDEARQVGQWAHKLGVQHRTLSIPWVRLPASASAASAPKFKPAKKHRKAFSPKGFLDVDLAPEYPAQAHMEEVGRIQRYQLLAQACREHQLQALLTGHHLGDLVETTFFRFWRESGIDGMAGISALTTLLTTYFCQRPGLPVARPLLLFPKARLRATCEAHGLPWAEDPSNHTPAFQRNVIRAEIQHASIGSSNQGIAASPTNSCSAGSHPSHFHNSPLSMDALYELSRRMQMRRLHAETLVQQYLQHHAQFDSVLGIAALDVPSIDGARREPTEWVSQHAVLSRVVVQILQWVSGDEQRPRTKNLHSLLLRIRAQSKAHPTGPGEQYSAGEALARVQLKLIEDTTRSAKLFPRAVPAHAKRWVFSRQPFYPHEIASTVMPVPLTPASDMDRPQWVCWTARFFCAAILSHDRVLNKAPKIPQFYVRALNNDDISYLRKTIRWWESIRKKEDPRIALARMQSVPVHVRHTLPVIVAKLQGQEVPVYVHALRIKRVHPAIRPVDFRVQFARRNPAQFSDWRFVALDPKLLNGENPKRPTAC
ncbi:hypothetical protein H4R35_004065 [Dimargaris xerosporica]|nr:hypothetical protein H4R35_004065 [Dimargaris xerosporica]